MFSHDPLTEETRELLDKVSLGVSVLTRTGSCALRRLGSAAHWLARVPDQDSQSCLSGAGPF